MTNMVMCVKLEREAEALAKPPYPGDLGQRVFENVSKEGWALWVQQQTKLMNEHRLTPIDPKARQYLEEQMDAFFFGDGGEVVGSSVTVELK